MQRLLFVSTLLVSLSLSPSLSLGADVAPRKDNVVSSIVNKVLDSVLKEMSGKNMSIGIDEVDLGEEVGRFSSVVGMMEGAVKKKVDGIKQWGLKLDVEVERVVVKGKYDLVYLDVPMLFPFFGKGDFSISLAGIALGLDMTAGFHFDKEEFDIELPRLDTTVRTATVRFENLMNDPSVSDFLNELISNLLPDLVTMITQPVLQALKPEIAKYANGILLCVKKELANDRIKECILELFTPTNDIQQNLLRLTKDALTTRLINHPSAPPKP